MSNFDKAWVQRSFWRKQGYNVEKPFFKNMAIDFLSLSQRKIQVSNS